VTPFAATKALNKERIGTNGSEHQVSEQLDKGVFNEERLKGGPKIRSCAYRKAKKKGGEGNSEGVSSSKRRKIQLAASVVVLNLGKKKGEGRFQKVSKRDTDSQRCGRGGRLKMGGPVRTAAGLYGKEKEKESKEAGRSIESS